MLERRKQVEIKRTFHGLSPSITRTLAFILYTILFPITRSTREKNERKKKKELKYTNGRKPILKTLSPSVLKNLGYLSLRGH